MAPAASGSVARQIFTYADSSPMHYSIGGTSDSMHVNIKVRIPRSRVECPMCGAHDSRKRYGGKYYASPMVILFRKICLQHVYQCEGCGEEFFASRFAR